MIKNEDTEIFDFDNEGDYVNYERNLNIEDALSSLKYTMKNSEYLEHNLKLKFNMETEQLIDRETLIKTCYISIL